MKRTALRRKTRLTARGRPRYARTPGGGGHAFWTAAFNQRLCAVTGAGAGPWDPHHVVERQEVSRRGGDVWDPRNALRLSRHAHARHTNAFRRVRLTELRDENIEFAFELLGAAAYVYLKRMYAGFDPRVEFALAELEAACKAEG